MNRSTWLVAFVAVAAAVGSVRGEDAASKPEAAPAVKLLTSVQPGGQLDTSLANEVNAAVNRGLDWLAAAQNPDGYWSNPKFPALTALALRAFVLGQHPKKQEVVARAVKYILSCVREDGGIYCDVPGQKGGGLSNYNTAICMAALYAVGDPALAPTIQKARRFVAAGQHLGGDEYSGGFGYDRSTGRAYTDLLNTYYATEAMRETQAVEDKRPAGEKKADVDWKAAAGFVEKMQNKPGTGDDAGGFFYNPTDAKAGATTNAEGVVVFRSFGTMTYAGLLALVYADVDRKDTRVRSAFEWACRHWSLDENPGMGAQGLYFFYSVLTKSLSAYGQDMVPLKGGKLLDWRGAVASKLVQIQRIDPANGQGYWKNDNGRFWENDPVLSSAYALVALELLR